MPVLLSIKQPDLNSELKDTCAALLKRGCDELGVVPSGLQQERLLTYLELLTKWNRAYNLTSVREPAEMVTRHLLDSLAIAPYLSGKRLIDVGTGGGLPGIPMAILYPEREFHLLDSNGKKTRFLFQVKTALSLDNMSVHQARVQSFVAAPKYDAVLSRAFASLEDMITGCRHLLAPGGRFLAMKGAFPEHEIAAIAEHCQVEAVHVLQVPGLSEQRHLVEMTPRS